MTTKRGDDLGANDELQSETQERVKPQPAARSDLRDTTADHERTDEGVGDKLKHAAKKTAGKAKEALGDLTDDERLKAEGQSAQFLADEDQRQHRRT